MMQIKPRIDCVDGDFDTEKDRIICVGNTKYSTVHLCFQGPMHIPFAEIKLSNSGRLRDAEAVFKDACRLGDEIAERWNNAEITKLKARCKKLMQLIKAYHDSAERGDYGMCCPGCGGVVYHDKNCTIAAMLKDDEVTP